MKHAKRSGWRPFWAALCAALLVLLPLVGGTVLLSRAQLRSSLRQAAKARAGCPSVCPKPLTSAPCCCAWQTRPRALCWLT